MLPRPSHQRGFTLAELMVTVTIMAVMVSLAIPSFSSFLARWQRDNVSRTLSSSLQLARSEAIKTSLKVVVCPTSDPSVDKPACRDGKEWKDGWLMFVDADGDATYDSSKGDRLIATRSAAAGVSSIVSESADPTDPKKKVDVKYLVFLPNGLLGEGRCTITVTPANASVKGNELDINQIGRVKVSTLT